MLKLYKEIEGVLNYWEAWPDGDVVVVHWGVVGQRGQARRHKPDLFSTHQKKADKLARKPMSEGYKEIPLGDHWTLTVQQRMTGNDAADLDRRNQMIDGLNNMLGWIGAGHVDGGDIGSGTTNVFAFIVAPSQTTPAVLDWLREIGQLAHSVVALDNPDESAPTTVIWPEDFDGEFSILGN